MFNFFEYLQLNIQSLKLFHFLFLPNQAKNMSTKGLRNNRFSVSGSSLLQNIEEKESHIIPEKKQNLPPTTHTFPSGHGLRIDLAGNMIDVTSPDGTPAVHISLKEEGPVVEVAGAKLSLKSPKDIDLSCKNFSVNTEEDVYMNANGGLIIESTQDLQLNCEVDVYIRAKVIWLN